MPVRRSAGYPGRLEGGRLLAAQPRGLGAGCSLLGMAGRHLEGHQWVEVAAGTQGAAAWASPPRWQVKISRSGRGRLKLSPGLLQRVENPLGGQRTGRSPPSKVGMPAVP